MPANVDNPMQKANEGKKVSSKSKRTSIPIATLLAIVVVALGGLSFYLYTEYQDSQDEIESLRNPENLERIQEDIVAQTVDAVKQIAITPEEDPTVATIIDAEALKTENPSFYADAQNGDKLLVFSTKAIIFREETNKIVNIAPVFIQDIEGAEQIQEEQVVDENSDSLEVEGATQDQNVEETENNEVEEDGALVP